MNRKAVRILIVEDIHYVLNTIHRVLSELGFTVRTAKRGAEALVVYREFAPHLVTVDQKLPDMTGLQLLESIKKIEQHTMPRIIFISALYEREEIAHILRSGVDAYLMKPFKKETLITTVRDVLEAAP